ncbi:MAG TPA: HlyD family secretion protein [Acetobacteraceae bacterium]|nr:HlyD family secretion protein [Acetobacteraceae bacterium]
MDGSLRGAGLVAHDIALPSNAIAGQRAGGLTKRLLLAAAALGIVAAGGVYGRDWWTVGRFQVETDDAYVAADSVLVSPKVSGYLDQVLVEDNQKVHAGQVVARIDDRDYRTALDQTRADVAAARADIDNLRQEIEQQAMTIDQARALVAADQAAVVFSEQQRVRYTDLARTGAGTVQQAQQYQADIQQKQAALVHDQAGIGVALKQVDVLRAQLARAQAALAQRQAMEHQAELNLSYTTITAPLDGTVGVRTLRVGQYVQAGTQLMALVPLQAVYVTANYKETQLTDVRPGQPVTIGVDTFPDAVVHGHVDSIAPAAGQEFSLLPPDNATGNFTKIVQRIPVKIDIDPHDPLAGMLRPGMSVEPTIDTKAGDTKAGDTKTGDTKPH